MHIARLAVLVVSAGVQATFIFLLTKSPALALLWVLFYVVVRLPLESDGYKLTNRSRLKSMAVSSLMILTAGWADYVAAGWSQIWVVPLVIVLTELVLPALRSEIVLIKGRFGVAGRPLRLALKVTERGIVRCIVIAASTDVSVTGIVCVGHRTVANLGLLTKQGAERDMDLGEYTLAIHVDAPTRLDVLVTLLK